MSSKSKTKVAQQRRHSRKRQGQPTGQPSKKADKTPLTPSTASQPTTRSQHRVYSRAHRLVHPRSLKERATPTAHTGRPRAEGERRPAAVGATEGAGRKGVAHTHGGPARLRAPSVRGAARCAVGVNARNVGARAIGLNFQVLCTGVERRTVDWSHLGGRLCGMVTKQTFRVQVSE